MKQIYKITYPNGKIYVGKDLTGTLNYFGSAKSDYIAKDFSAHEKMRFTITKEILWECDSCDNSIVNKKEVEYILSLKSNNPSIGYNQWPKYKGE